MNEPPDLGRMIACCGHLGMQYTNRQLREAMGGYEQDALRVIDADSYDLAEGQTPQPLTPSKERRLKLLYYLAYWARFLM